MSRLTYITPQSYHDVLYRNKHVILNIRSTHCVPCEKGFKLFEELSEKRKDLVFAVYEIEKSKFSKTFIDEVLQINAVPTFDVYTNSYRVFRTTSPKNFHQLEDYIERNI